VAQEQDGESIADEGDDGDDDGGGGSGGDGVRLPLTASVAKRRAVITVLWKEALG